MSSNLRKLDIISVKLKYILLFFAVPPYVDTTAASPDHMTPIQNTPLVINCPISGVPTPNITWYKDGEVISSSNHVTISANGRRLTVTDTQVDDSGSYKCVGENTAGKEEKTFLVKVNGRKNMI